jgi:hypothetical protein
MYGDFMSQNWRSYGSYAGLLIGGNGQDEIEREPRYAKPIDMSLRGELLFNISKLA